MSLIVSLMDGDRVVFNHRFTDCEHSLLRDMGICTLVQYPIELGYTTGAQWSVPLRAALRTHDRYLPFELPLAVWLKVWGDVGMLAIACVENPDARPSVITRCTG